jgi:Domain of unknown function (DUF4290)
MLDIEYNSAREPVEFPEYGRYIQGLLQHACNIEDDYKRQKTAEAIVAMMQLLNPNNRGIEDYRERLWNHANAIAGFKLNVTPPKGVILRDKEELVKPDPVPYPIPNLRFRHYGSSVQRLVEKAIEMPDGPKKEGLVEVIASYMKLAYKTWNKEHYVSDDIVKEDLVHLSNGQLELHEGHNSLDTLSMYAHKQARERPSTVPVRTGRKRSGTGGGGGNNSGNRNKQRTGGGAGNSGGNAGNFRKRKR